MCRKSQKVLFDETSFEAFSDLSVLGDYTTNTEVMPFISSLSEVLGEKLEKVSLEQYLEEDFALLYVASGGSEGFFLKIANDADALFSSLRQISLLDRKEQERCAVGLGKPEHRV